MSVWRELKMYGRKLRIYTHTYTHRTNRWTRLRITKLNQNQSFQNSAFPGLCDFRAIEKSSKYGNTSTVSRTNCSRGQSRREDSPIAPEMRVCCVGMAVT